MPYYLVIRNAYDGLSSRATTLLAADTTRLPTRVAEIAGVGNAIVCKKREIRIITNFMIFSLSM